MIVLRTYIIQDNVPILGSLILSSDTLLFVFIYLFCHIRSVGWDVEIFGGPSLLQTGYMFY